MRHRGTVLVLQTGLRSGPWTCRSLRAAGFRAVAGHDEGRLAGRTRFADAFVRLPSPVRDPDGYAEAVARAARAHGARAVLPLEEYAIAVLLQRTPPLGDALLVGPTRAQYDRLCDKGALGAAAAAAGVGHPASVVVGPDGPRGEWPPLPAVVKLRRSGRPVTGRGATPVSTEAERDTAVARLVAETGEALVQERVEGRGLRAHLVRGPDGAPGLLGLSLARMPRQAGMTSVSAYAPLPPQVAEAAERLLASAGYQGPVGIQFIARGEDLLVHDVNLRLPAAVAGTMAAGLDMPRLAVEAALDGAAPGPVRVRADARYVWLDGEARALARAAGRRDAAGAARIAGVILRTAGARRGVVDAGPLSDPAPLASTLAVWLRRARRR